MSSVRILLNANGSNTNTLLALALMFKPTRVSLKLLYANRVILSFFQSID